MPENNAPQFEVNDVTECDSFSESPAPSPGKLSKKHLLKFLIAFIAILVIVGGGYFAWNNYLSPSARYARQMQENYQKYLDWQTKYETAMKADTHGGKTPEETLSLFEEALKKQDVDLASDYFLLDDDGEKNPVVKENIKKIITENRTKLILDILNKLKPSARDTGSTDTKEFVVLTQQGFVDYSITLKLNKYSNVWKIENM